MPSAPYESCWPAISSVAVCEVTEYTPPFVAQLEKFAHIMSFGFPSVPDVRLNLSPLVEVVCQVRFPLLLRIAGERPVEFQELLRDRFPEMSVEQSVLFKLSPPEPPTPIDAPPTIYRLSTADGQTSVSLASDFFALTTHSYTHWRDFAELLDQVQQAAIDVYHLPYSSRIGLRYINRIAPERLGVSGRANTLGLIRPELTAPLRAEPLMASNEMLTQLVLSDGLERLAIRVGFGADDSGSFILLDYDRFVEGQLPLAGVMERCRQYHDEIYNAFRWSIPEDQLPHFGPRPVE